MIDQTQLTVLEQKVSRLMTELRSLRAENERLESEVEQSNARLRETVRELELLRENTQLLTSVQEENERFRANREKLRKTLDRLHRRVSTLSAGLED